MSVPHSAAITFQVALPPARRGRDKSEGSALGVIFTLLAALRLVDGVHCGEVGPEDIRVGGNVNAAVGRGRGRAWWGRGRARGGSRGGPAARRPVGWGRGGAARARGGRRPTAPNDAHVVARLEVLVAKVIGNPPPLHSAVFACEVGRECEGVVEGAAARVEIRPFFGRARDAVSPVRG